MSQRKVKKICAKLDCILKIFCLFILILITAKNVVQGPISTWMRNGTKFRENEILIQGIYLGGLSFFLKSKISDKNLLKILLLDLEQPIEFPGLSICKVPMFKNKEKYQEFVSKSKTNTFIDEKEYNQMLNETFPNKIEEFVLKLGIGKDIFGAIENLNKIPVTAPYAKGIFVDFLYVGYCAIVSFEALKKYMVVEEKIDGNQDFDFYVILSINVGLVHICISEDYSLQHFHILKYMFEYFREKIHHWMVNFFSNCFWMEKIILLAWKQSLTDTLRI